MVIARIALQSQNFMEVYIKMSAADSVKPFLNVIKITHEYLGATGLLNPRG
jgi:hypothetical protein